MFMYMYSFEMLNCWTTDIIYTRLENELHEIKTDLFVIVKLLES